MTPAERSQRLRSQADHVLELIRLRECCREIGDLTPTGSYFMNLMMHPDIDLYLPVCSVGALLNVGARLASHDSVKEIHFQKGSAFGRPDLAEGLYLKPVVQFGEWERKWKIDIWSLPDAVIQKNRAELADIRVRMTQEQRLLILDYKFSILTPGGRTPSFSGIHVYRAVVNLGMTDFGEIGRYLRQNGITM